MHTNTHSHLLFRCFPMVNISIKNTITSIFWMIYENTTAKYIRFVCVATFNFNTSLIFCVFISVSTIRFDLILYFSCESQWNSKNYVQSKGVFVWDNICLWWSTTLLHKMNLQVNEISVWQWKEKKKPKRYIFLNI